MRARIPFKAETPLELEEVDCFEYVQEQVPTPETLAVTRREEEDGVVIEN
jgi:hypothetical protein